MRVVVVINHPGTATFAMTWPGDTNLPQTGGALNESPSPGSPGQKLKHGFKSFIAQ